MALTFDPDKDIANIAKHGVSLARAGDFDSLTIIPDLRRDYREDRSLGFGMIDGQPYCLVFVIRDGDIRAISLRRAHWKEMNRHAPRG